MNVLTTVVWRLELGTAMLDNFSMAVVVTGVPNLGSSEPTHGWLQFIPETTGTYRIFASRLNGPPTLDVFTGNDFQHLSAFSSGTTSGDTVTLETVLQAGVTYWLDIGNIWNLVRITSLTVVGITPTIRALQKCLPPHYYVTAAPDVYTPRARFIQDQMGGSSSTSTSGGSSSSSSNLKPTPSPPSPPAPLADYLWVRIQTPQFRGRSYFRIQGQDDLGWQLYSRPFRVDSPNPSVIDIITVAPGFLPSDLVSFSIQT